MSTSIVGSGRRRGGGETSEPTMARPTREAPPKRRRRSSRSSESSARPAKAARKKPVPASLTERLDKARAHIEAAGWRLRYDTERALWSGRQAAARAEEISATLHRRKRGLTPVTTYLRSYVLQPWIEEFDRAAAGTPLGTRIRAFIDAEAAILAEPFPRPPNDDRDALEAGLARERRYLGALHALMRDVENEVADRYIVLHPGDWVTLPDGPIGCLVSRQGLEGCFLAPSLDPSPAMESPERAMTRWSLDDPAIAPAKPECRPPADALCYYWLLAANRRWQTACRLTEDDEVTLPYLRDRLTDILDAAAKAWLSVTDPGSDRVAWAQICAGQHVPLLEAGAPSSVALPLTEALRRCEAMLSAPAERPGHAPAGWRDTTETVLRLARNALTALEEGLHAEVMLTVGQWVHVPGYGFGRIVFRDGPRLAVDLEPSGVLATSLFRIPLHAFPPQARCFSLAGPEEIRWLWFVCRPEACSGRAVCPCCGLPGIEGEKPGDAPCLLCGWLHDGGDYEPHRPNPASAGLGLSLGRRRFAALGYAIALHDGTPERAAAWFDLRVLVCKRRLVAALCDVAGCEATDPASLEAVDGLRDIFRATLARHTRRRKTDA